MIHLQVEMHLAQNGLSYPTLWLSRLNHPGEDLDAIPDDIGNNMTNLLKFIYRHIVIYSTNYP